MNYKIKGYAVGVLNPHPKGTEDVWLFVGNEGQLTIKPVAVVPKEEAMVRATKLMIEALEKDSNDIYEVLEIREI